MSGDHKLGPAAIRWGAKDRLTAPVFTVTGTLTVPASQIVTGTLTAPILYEKLQVRFGGSNHLIGWVPIIGPHVTGRTLRLSRSHCDGDNEWIMEDRIFTIGRRAHRVPRLTLLNHHPNILSDVPGYAAIESEPMSGDTIFTWSVLQIDAEEHEWLFDHPDFEPADTAIDQSTIA